MGSGNSPPFASAGVGGPGWVAGGGWMVAVGGLVDQARHHGRGDRRRQAAAEWASRAGPSYAQGSERKATGRQRAGAATAVRRLPSRLQQRAAARGAGPEDAGVAVRAVAAALPGSAHRTELRRRCPGPPGAQQRPDQMGRQLIFVSEASIPPSANTPPL